MKVENKKVKQALEALEKITGKSYTLRTDNTRRDLFPDKFKYFLYTTEAEYLSLCPKQAFMTQKNLSRL